MKRWMAGLVAAAVFQAPAARAADPTAAPTHIRIVHQERIAEAFDLARNRSEAFRATVEAIESSDVYALIEDGSCPGPLMRSCLHLLVSTSPNFRALRIRVDGRQTTHELVAELAHELRHASEVAAHPNVIDVAGLRAMYRAIGYRSCNAYGMECWETREAQATERLVREQIQRFEALARRR